MKYYEKGPLLTAKSACKTVKTACNTKNIAKSYVSLQKQNDKEMGREGKFNKWFPVSTLPTAPFLDRIFSIWIDGVVEEWLALQS